MAQQLFDQYVPLAKVSANETIPVVAAIAQTRDGKDELLHGTVPFVPAGGLYVPVSAANRLPVEATLSGSIVDEIAVFDALAIVDTQIKYSSPIRLSEYRALRIIARNSLDAEVELRIQLRNLQHGTAYWDQATESWVNWTHEPFMVVLPGRSSGTVYRDVTSKVPHFEKPCNSLAISLRARTAPTVGSISVWIWGVR